jgi:cation diffusion facilitator family transporter
MSSAAVTPAPPAPNTASPQVPSGAAEKRWVAGVSILWAMLVTALKVIVGIGTHSLGILSEALHSSLDLTAAAITFFSVRVSDRPADSEHQYGHEKMENLSAFLQALLLLATSVWIVYEAVGRLLFHRVEIQPTVAAFLVMAFSMAVDWWRSRALMRVARRYSSQALEADALHFSSDVWSSLVVVFGLLLVWGGRHYGVPDLRVADPLAAMAVSGIVAGISVRLAKRTLDGLLDAAPPGMRSRLYDEVRAVEGVLGSDRVRIRHAGARYFVDANISVQRTATFEHVKAISDAVQTRILRHLPGADVIIHTEPRASVNEDLFEKVKAVAARHAVNVHDLSALDTGEDGESSGMHQGLHLELHVEVSDTLTLRQAHDLVDRLEEEIRAEAPGLASINTHIEEAGAHIERAAAQTPERADWMRRRLQEIAEEHPQVVDCHEVSIRLVRERVFVSCHFHFNGDLPVARVHEVTAEVEARFRREFPQIFRVMIHSEPL